MNKKKEPLLPARRSRYNCKSNAPENLRNILKELDKTYATVPIKGGLDTVRNLIMRFHPYKGEPGTAYDVAKFLINVGALHEGNGVLYFNAARCTEVLVAIEQRRDPAPIADVAPCIRYIMQIHAAAKRPSATATPPSANALASAVLPTSPSTEAAMAAAPTPAVNPQALIPPSLEFELQPDASELTAIACTGIKQGITHWTLYLTPLEHAAWIDLVLRVGSFNAEDRVGIPHGDFALDPSWGPENKDYDRDEYINALARFVSYGIVQYIGDGKPGLGRGVFSFRVCPDNFTPVEIPERFPVPIARAYMRLIRAVQSGKFLRNSWKNGWGPHFLNWAEAQEPDLSPETASRKLCNDDLNEMAGEMVARGRRADSRGGWGILKIQDEQLRICWPGFEPYAFEATDEAPRRRIVQRKADVGTEPSPTGATPPPVIPTPTPTPIAPYSPTMEDLDAEEAETLRRLEEIRERKANLASQRRKELEDKITEAMTRVQLLEDQVNVARTELRQLEEELAALPK